MDTQAPQRNLDLSDDDLRAEKRRLEELQTQLRPLTKGRPNEWSALRVSVATRSSIDFQAMRQAASEWDAANPEGAAAAAKLRDAVDRVDAIRGELDKRETRAAKDDACFAVLADMPRLAKAVQAGLADTQANDAVREWAKSESWCLLLLGGVGCGKSTACAGYAVKHNETNYQKNYRQQWPGWARWVRAVEASRLSGFGQDAEDRLQEWRTSWLLVLDDLGTELMTPTWQQALEDVLDHRYQHSLPTMLPSNLSMEAFKTRYGERIADRIRQDGTVRVLDAKSMRKRQQP